MTDLTVAFSEDAERIAAAFHEVYEELAPAVGYRTREASRVRWDDVPEQNKRLMTWTVQTLLARGIVAIASDRLNADFASRVERDLHEPDKLLCHIAWARRILDDRAWMRSQVGAEAAAIDERQKRDA